MIGRMVLLSGFALVFLLALGLNRYLNRALIKPRVVRWLAQGLFVALIPALLAPAAVIAINPTVPYPARIELMLYVYLFYAGAGVALVCVVALSAVAGVIAIRRGDVRRFLKRSVAFVRRFADALRYGSRVWMDRRNNRIDFPDTQRANSHSYIDYTLLYNASIKGEFGSLAAPTSSGHLNDPRNHLPQDQDLLVGRNTLSPDRSDL